MIPRPLHQAPGGYTRQVARFLLLMVMMSGLSAVRGQETVNLASLSGRVMDASGAVVVAATVQARQEATDISRQMITGGDGRFHFAYLPAGSYVVTVRAGGFAGAERSLTLSVGAAFDLPVTLAAGSVQVQETISAEAPPIETDRSQIAGTVSEAEIAELPFLGRSYLDLALLLPGVSATNTGSNQTFFETTAVSGQGLSVNSQRNFSNSFIVDGLSANDDAAGLVATSFGLDTIREMQVVSSGGQAEFGRALGGYINFVTRSGTNVPHGTAYGYLRNQRLNAANALSGTKLPLTEAQYGGSVGGPIRRERTFAFGNFERLSLNQDRTITIGGTSAAAIDTKLAAVGYRGPLLAIDSSGVTNYPNPIKSNNLFLKVDHHGGDRDDASLRYSLYHVANANSRYVGGLYDVSAGAALADLDQTVAGSNIFAFTPRTVNETRGQFTRSNLQAPPNVAVGPSVVISGVAQFGELSLSPTARYSRLYEVVDNLSHQAGAHSLRAGADFLYNDLSLTYPLDVGGVYAFASLPSFQQGRYTTFTQSFGNSTVRQTNPNLGMYVQDEWKARPNLTINAGVRYDLQFLETISTDTNNVSPRLGIVWTPFPDRRTVVRADAGLFYDRVPLRALSNAIQYSGNTTALTASTFTTLVFNYGQAGAPVFPSLAPSDTALTLPANQRIGLSTMDPHFQNAYAEQVGVEVEQQLGAAGSTLALSYQHLRGLHLLTLPNLNPPACTAAVDPVNLCRPNARLANLKQYSAIGDSYYDGLGVSLVQRPGRWGSYRLSYTWSHAIDDVGESFFSAPLNNYDLAEDRGRSDDDQRHRVVLDATAHTPADGSHRLVRGFLVSGILQYYSRLPFNILTGANSIQQTPLRPCVPGLPSCTAALPGTVTGRNAGTGFDAFTVNARLARGFVLHDSLRLQAVAEGFNVLNHRNDQIPNNSTSSSGFGQATAVADPRSVQLALRLSF